MKAKVKATGKVVDVFVCEEQQQFGVIYTPKYFADELDFNVEDDRTVIIDGCVARDQNGTLYLSTGANSMMLPSNIFPDRKFEKGPTEVSITIKIK